MMAGLADLPWDLVWFILQKRPIRNILILVSCLTTWWEHFKKERVHSKVQLPWLLIHPLPHDKEKAEIAAFFDLSEANIVHILVPHPPFQERICIGSTGGWMVTITKRTLQAHLLNPVSGQQIDLPRFHHMSEAKLNDDLSSELVVENVGKFFMYSKAVINWGNGNEIGKVAFTVVILLFARGYVVVSRGGQPDWQVLQPPQFYEDVMIDAITGRFFLLDPIGKRLNISRLQHQDSQSSLGFLSLDMFQEHDLRFSYLAGWFLGKESEIFILTKRIRTGVHSNGIAEIYFKVFRYDGIVGNFEEVNDLGGKSIFVGANNAIVTSLPGLRRNSIYYLYDCRHPNHICMYDMEDQSVQRIEIGADIPSLQRHDAVWLNPSFD